MNKNFSNNESANNNNNFYNGGIVMMNGAMNMESFAEVVVMAMEGRYGEGNTVETTTVTKNNDCQYVGLVIKDSACNICPTIYLEAFHEQYKSGRDINSIFDDIAAVYEKHRVVSQKTSSGIDMIPANKAVSYVEKNYKHIINNICCGNYKPSDVLLVKIPKRGSTKKRKLAIATMMDRVVLRCIYGYLEPIYDVIFDDYSYGFRKNRNCHKAVFHVMDYLYQDYRYVISLDLRDCFGNISHDRILFKLRHKGIDEDVIKLINKFLKVLLCYKNSWRQLKRFKR